MPTTDDLDVETPTDYHGASQITGLSVRALRARVLSDEIPYYRMKRTVRFLPSELRAWMQAQRRGVAA